MLKPLCKLSSNHKKNNMSVYFIFNVGTCWVHTKTGHSERITIITYCSQQSCCFTVRRYSEKCFSPLNRTISKNRRIIYQNYCRIFRRIKHYFAICIVRSLLVSFFAGWWYAAEINFEGIVSEALVSNVAQHILRMLHLF